MSEKTDRPYSDPIREREAQVSARRRAEAERLAHLTDIHADVVEAHLIALERKGFIQMAEHYDERP